MLPKLFVIIVTYKGHQWYKRCFTSLRNSEYPVQTVVIDNASNDGTVEYIREHFPEIHLIESKENLGFGRANNLGMRYALDNECDYVFLLNQDAWIETDTISKLVNIAVQYPEYGIISPIHLNALRTVINMHLGVGAHSRNEKLLSDLYLNRIEDIYDTNYVNAAAWLLTRDTIKTVGGFDPLFFMYGEDDNYLHRVQYHGFKIGVCPKTCIVHDHQGSTFSDKKHPLRQKQFLLLSWTNINMPFSVWRISRYYIRKFFVYIVKCDSNAAKNVKSNLQLCIKMRKQIYQSRKENIQIKSSWL